jgi:hypothetical protein
MELFMGTQQLLLIVLGVVIVGVAIAVGITLFKSNAEATNRDQVVSDLENLGSVAQQYYRKPISFGGGEGNFQNFSLPPLDTANGNGSFSLSTSLPSGAGYVAGSVAPISSSQQVIYIIGCGNELGDNAIDPVKAMLKVTADSLQVTVLN